MEARALHRGQRTIRPIAHFTTHKWTELGRERRKRRDKLRSSNDGAKAHWGGEHISTMGWHGSIIPATPPRRTPGPRRAPSAPSSIPPRRRVPPRRRHTSVVSVPVPVPTKVASSTTASATRRRTLRTRAPSPMPSSASATSQPETRPRPRIRSNVPAPPSVPTPAPCRFPPVRRRRPRAALDRQLTARPSRDRHALGELHHDAEIVPGDEAQLVERPVLLRVRVRLGLDVLEEARGGVVEGARLAEDVARVDGAEVFLGEAAAGGGVCEHGAEEVAREGMAVLGRVGRGGAEGGEHFAEGGVSPDASCLLAGRRVSCMGLTHQVYICCSSAIGRGPSSNWFSRW